MGVDTGEVASKNGKRPSASSPFTDPAREFIEMSARDARWARTAGRIALATSLVAALSIVGNIYQASLPRAIPYVVQLAPNGPTVNAAQMQPAYTQRPDVPWVRYMLSEWIVDARSVTSDPNVQSSFQGRTAKLLAAGSPAESDVHAYYQTNPANGGDNRVSVKINYVRPASGSDRRYEADWVEQTVDRQGHATGAHWNGVVTVDYSPDHVTVPAAGNDDPTASNPYGMYITDLSWNKVAY